MKKQYLLFLAIIYSFSSYGQILFEQGYYINNSNEKIDCFIKNNDWEKTQQNLNLNYYPMVK